MLFTRPNENQHRHHDHEHHSHKLEGVHKRDHLRLLLQHLLVLV